MVSRPKLLEMLQKRHRRRRWDRRGPGYRAVEWNASTLAGGVYIYRPEAVSVADPGATFSTVKKTLLIK